MPVRHNQCITRSLPEHWAGLPPHAAAATGLGELSGLLLGRQKVVPQRLLDTGYRFRFTTIDSALADLFKDTA